MRSIKSYFRIFFFESIQMKRSDKINIVVVSSTYKY